MGMLVEGVWKDVPRDTRLTGGEFVRTESLFRDQVTADGATGYRAEAGRYHLYVALSCPWAHRTVVYRALKGLEQAVTLSAAGPISEPNGWTFESDPVNGARYLHEVYVKARPGYTGRVTVPVLWDRKTGTIVNNESSEIIRMLNREFDAHATRRLPDMYPGPLRAEIDRWNELIYRTVNNGVYRAGFATAQEKYKDAVRQLFETFETLEQHLARYRYLCGRRMTEADWRLFTTLVRFDAVYHYHFKCNLYRLVDYPNLWAYTRELYQFPGVAATVDLKQIKEHYYASQPRVNPSRIVALGPVLDASDFSEPHGREQLAARSGQ
ncbi:MAG TPA: glutathione S-transferase family protein [Burkholderiales bacterium]|nr:glutathione S-transferase family protein [Burkholderiales bacterium]